MTVPSDAPGLYLLHAPAAAEPARFQAAATGRLASTARRAGWTLHFDGLLTAGRVEGQSDAETALDRLLAGGPDEMHALDGFYNVLLISEAEGRLYAISDPLSARPWYAYRHGETLALAPTPLAFARWDLPMTLDRLELFHVLRFGHSSFGQTLVREVELLRPGVELRIESGAVTTRETFDAPYREDRGLSLDACAEWVKSLVADVVEGVRTHPRVCDLPLYLPLTSGLDSRHLLAELLAQERPPAALQHVLIKRSDFEPVVQIAEGLGLPLHCTAAADLDWRALVRRWAERSAGLVSVHQSYLLHMAEDAPPGGALGFDGYLMDWLLAVNPWQSAPVRTDAGAHVWSRHYTPQMMLRALLPDAAERAEESLALFRQRAQRFDGPEWVKSTLLDVHHRGLHYTGPLDPMFADAKIHASPGAHRRSLDFFLTVPRDVGGDRRARLEAMRRYFPELAAYPDASGVPYSAYSHLQKFRSGKRRYALPMLKALASGFRTDPAPESEHAWLRQIEVLHAMHRRVVERSALVEDGHVRGSAVRASWWGLRAGGYQGWTLMALLTAETAYRLLVRREPLDAVLTHFLDAD